MMAAQASGGALVVQQVAADGSALIDTLKLQPVTVAVQPAPCVAT